MTVSRPLIHDFDALRLLNPGAEPVAVFALATAEASFQAVYGYDVRGEVLGSAGMLTLGDVRSTT
jgi:myo-inositol 2-dehydrogenase/D-chiro-inositol 1-dehydrogenase